MKKNTIFLFIFLASFFAIPLISRAEEVAPEDNPLCWDEKVCTADYTGPEGKKDQIPDGEFDNTSSRAKTTCGGSLGFCYPTGESYELEVSLPLGSTPTKVVFGLGDYIDKVYKFLLAIAMIFAVLMIMVGGLEYLLSSGGQEAKKAMERVGKAVAGLVLLFCATLILFTVNPRFLSLNFAKIPKVRTLAFFGGQIKCEDLIRAGYVMERDLSDESVATCGRSGQATGMTTGQLLQDKIDCIWTGCNGTEYSYSSGGSPPRVQKSCYWDVNGSPACVSCEEATTGPPFHKGVKPSATACAALQPIFYNSSGSASWQPDAKYHATCEFSRDLSFEPTEAADTLINGQCAVVAFDCDQINECNDYDAIVVFNNDGHQDLDAFESPTYYDYSVHKEICEGNPCGLAGGCRQDYSALFDTFFKGLQVYAAAVTLGKSTAAMSFASSLSGSEPNGLSCESR
jgi:hypothetical protein